MTWLTRCEKGVLKCNSKDIILFWRSEICIASPPICVKLYIEGDHENRSVSAPGMKSTRPTSPLLGKRKIAQRKLRMSAVHEVIDSEIERVERWRIEELMRATACGA